MLKIWLPLVDAAWHDTAYVSLCLFRPSQSALPTLSAELPIANVQASVFRGPYPEQFNGREVEKSRKRCEAPQVAVSIVDIKHVEDPSVASKLL